MVTKKTITPRVWVDKLCFNDGSEIELKKDDITVFVGPNNAGKSATLKEMAALLKSSIENVKVLKNISIAREGEYRDVLKFLERFTIKDLSRGDVLLKGNGYSVWENSIEPTWEENNISKGLGDISEAFVSVLSTENRLLAANPPKSIRLTTEPATHPIHHLYKNDEIESLVSKSFREAFGTDLIVHRAAGSEIPLYVGDKPDQKKGSDRVSKEYLEELEKRDALHTQGDGMRSFVGVLLNSVVSKHSTLFIDEPEAFLHPPQARLLGKMLAENASKNQQLFLATHSEDFLKGLLDADLPNLNIVRIQRNGSINNIRTLDSEDIESVWGDTLLRHSNVLAGLFHSRVVICESDADCRFYSALMSAQSVKESHQMDTLFIHCGGKHRMPTVVKALEKLGVPIKVAVDFDILSDVVPAKSIYENLGGKWIDVEADFKLVKYKIEEKKPELETEELKKEIEQIFKTVSSKTIPLGKISEINKSLKKASAWAHAKQTGSSFIPSGEPTLAFKRLNAAFEKKGLFVVPVGELESFDRRVGNHGPKWVNEVLQKDLSADTELGGARKFVNKLSK